MQGNIFDVRFGQLLRTWTQTGTTGPDDTECPPNSAQLAHGHEVCEGGRCSCGA